MGKSKEKKRKTLDGEEGSSDENKGKQLETLDVQIRVISENPDKKTSPPIIGYFPSGFDPMKNSGESDSKSGAGSRMKIYKDASRNPKNPRMEVVVGGSAVNFVGTNYSGEAKAPQLCNYALGVLDKETGVLKMVPVAANKIFRLEPRIIRLEQPEVETPDAAKKIDTVEERAEKFRNVTVKYSTNQNRRKDEKRETLRQTGDSGAQENMEDRLKGIEVKKEALEAIASTANARNSPPYDLEAKTAEMAYPLDRIILRGEWDYLQDIFGLVQGESELAPDVYPSFVCNRVHKVQNTKDESNKRRIAGILSYITHLIKFKDRHSMDGVSSAKRHKLPTILSQKFSTMFASTKDKRIPEDKLNLLISYVLVLSLFADDFLSDPSDIAKDLRMTPFTLRTHYEFLGCKFVHENQVLVATLPVPLEFQTTKKRKRRKQIL